MKIKLKWAALGIIIGLTFAGLWIKLDQNKSLESKIESYLEKYDRNPAGSPPASNRKFWDLIPKKVERINPDKTLNPLEVIRIGTLQECSYYSGEWISPIEQSIDKLLKESWTDQPNPQEISEKAAILSHCVETLKDNMNPEINQRVKTKVKEELIKPLLAKWADEKTERETEKNADRGEIQPPLKNIEILSPQYLANILTCGLIVEENLKIKAALVISIMNKLEEYKNQVDPSGYMPGGIRQWNKEISHYILAIERILSATGGKINLYNDNKIKKILEFPGAASFPTKDSDSPKYFPTFGGNTNPSGIEPILLDILSKRFESPPSIDKEYTPSELLSGALYSAYGNLQKVSIPIEPLAINRTATAGFESKGKDLVVVFNNDKNMALSATSGNDNSKLEIGESGAYTIFELGEDGSKWDFVAGSINTKKDPDDSKVFNHPQPIPLINSSDQSIRDNKAVKIQVYKNTSNRVYIKYDLLGSYKIEGLDKLTRVLIYNKAESILTIRDEFESNLPINFGTRLITSNGLIEKKKGYWLFDSENGEFVLEAYGSNKLMISKVPKNQVGINTRELSLLKKSKKGFIEYRIRPKVTNITTSETIRRKTGGKEALLVHGTKWNRKSDSEIEALEMPGQFTVLSINKNIWNPLLGKTTSDKSTKDLGIVKTTIGTTIPSKKTWAIYPQIIESAEIFSASWDISEAYYPDIIGQITRSAEFDQQGNYEIVEEYILGENSQLEASIPLGLKIKGKVIGNNTITITAQEEKTKDLYTLRIWGDKGLKDLDINISDIKKIDGNHPLIKCSFTIESEGKLYYNLRNSSELGKGIIEIPKADSDFIVKSNSKRGKNEPPQEYRLRVHKMERGINNINLSSLVEGNERIIFSMGEHLEDILGKSYSNKLPDTDTFLLENKQTNEGQITSLDTTGEISLTNEKLRVIRTRNVSFEGGLQGWDKENDFPMLRINEILESPVAVKLHKKILIPKNSKITGNSIEIPSDQETIKIEWVAGEFSAQELTRNGEQSILVLESNQSKHKVELDLNITIVKK